MRGAAATNAYVLKALCQPNVICVTAQMKTAIRWKICCEQVEERLR